MNNYPEESNLYRLNEMLDAMRHSIDNARDVKAQQEELIDVVKGSEKADKFKVFIKDMTKQIENLEEQIAELDMRTVALDRVCSYLEDEADENTKSLFDDLLNALGVFRQ